MNPFVALREACAEMMQAARFVHVDTEAARALALHFSRGPSATWDEATHYRGDADSTLAYVLVLDTLNFGSGWFPVFEKRPGRSGYFTLSMGLKEAFEAEGPFSAARLGEFDAPGIALLLGQRAEEPELQEFFALQARALRDLGTLVGREYGGSFTRLREAAGFSAAALVGTLVRMPLFRDVATTATGLEIPFYKRAQIAAADLATAFAGAGYGAFQDLDELCAFADNTLPNVLRCEGVLRYEESLAEAIRRGAEIASGSPREIELRAAAVHSVEIMTQYLRARGEAVEARELDAWLWHRGQGAAFKASPRHRTRCTFY